MRETAPAVAELLKSDTYVYICGLKGMEAGVMEALQDICTTAGMNWSALHQTMVAEGRFHVETY